MKRLLGIALCCLMAGPALALDFSRPITDYDDKPIVFDGKEWTLGRAAASALFSNLPGDDKVSAEAKFDRAQLALKVRNGGDVQVSSEEITQIKKAIGAAFGPLVILRAYEMLDPGSKPEADKSAPPPTANAPLPKE